MDDIWSINDDQKEYYIAQFKTMQPDLSKTITGEILRDYRWEDGQKQTLDVPAEDFSAKQHFQMWSVSLIGAVAKEFFEKSKLHVHELSKIWSVW